MSVFPGEDYFEDKVVKLTDFLYYARIELVIKRDE